MYKQAKKNIKVIKKEMLKHYCEMCLGFFDDVNKILIKLIWICVFLHGYVGDIS